MEAIIDLDRDIDRPFERAQDASDEAPRRARAEAVRARAVPRRTSGPVARKPKPRDEQPPDGAPLAHYLRELRAPRVLSKEETYELARAMEAARESFADELCAIPGTAVKLVERWNARRRHGHVTAALSARYRDGTGKDRSPEIDRVLRRLERLTERRDALVGGSRRSSAQTQELATLEAQIARATRRAGIAFALLEELNKELLALVGAPRTRAAREARRRFGLDDPAHRAHLRRAQAAVARIDREKQTFVTHNLRLVVKQAKRFRNMGVPYEDLIQEGNLGMIRAVEKFDHRLGYRFSTYAVWWIDQALVRAVQNHSRTVRVPTHVYDLAVRLRRIRGELHTKLARAPTLEELAEATDTTAADVKRATAAMQPIASTQATLLGTEERTLEDVLADENVADPIEGIDNSQIAVSLGRKLAQLEPRERGILEARYGLSGRAPTTLQAIGERMGLSRERVRQIEARALARLREDADVEELSASLHLARG